jgi:hypothetical protein
MDNNESIAKYFDENLKKGYSKEQIKIQLLKSYPEKEVLKIFKNRPDPKLIEKHKGVHTALVILVLSSLFMSFMSLIFLIFLNNNFSVGKFQRRVVEFTIYIAPVFGLLKHKKWSYQVYFIIGFALLIDSLESVFTQTQGFLKIFFVIQLIINMGIIILSVFCLKKIFPASEAEKSLDKKLWIGLGIFVVVITIVIVLSIFLIK